MPLYEYQCDACNHRFERIQKFSDAPLTECPVCGGPVRKLLSSPAIQFKGSGFYITDYARSGQASSSSPSEKSTKSEKPEKPATETSSTASSSSGDAAKTPAAPAAAKPTGSPGT